MAPGELAAYVELVSERSRRHAQAVIARAGWRTCGPGEWRALGDWLTVRALEQVSDEAIANLSPGQFETINPYGTLTFDIPGVLERPRRPTRRP